MAAVTIQAIYRGWKCRQMVHRIRATLIIQTAIRGFLSRRRVEVSQTKGMFDFEGFPRCASI